MERSIVNLPIESVMPDPEQPRKWFNKEELETLAANIAEHGVLEPILVRSTLPVGVAEQFVIIAGERRWRASKIANQLTIPAIVRDDMKAHAIEEAAISENVARSNLNPVEEARAFEKLKARGLTIAAIARKAGATTGFVEGRLSILTLDPDIIRLVETGQMGATSAISIARLPRSHQNIGLRAVADGLTDAQLRVFVDDILNRLAQVELFDEEIVEQRSKAALDLRTRVDRAIDLSVNAMYALVDRKSRELLPSAYKGDFTTTLEKLAILEREVHWVRQLLAAAASGSKVSDEELAAMKAPSEEVPA